MKKAEEIIKRLEAGSAPDGQKRLTVALEAYISHITTKHQPNSYQKSEPRQGNSTSLAVSA